MWLQWLLSLGLVVVMILVVLAVVIVVMAWRISGWIVRGFDSDVEPPMFEQRLAAWYPKEFAAREAARKRA